jgi:hypothetical protein
MMHFERLDSAHAASWSSLDQPGFSLVVGGPLYQICRRTRLLVPPLQLVSRRIIAFVLICWLPPFVLATVAGDLIGRVRIPFPFDIEVHAKFLAALPLLIVADLIVHRRLQIVVGQFLDCGIIESEDRGRFQELIVSLMRLRNSILVEAVLLLIAIIAGHRMWIHNLALGTSTWYGYQAGGQTLLTAAGYWYAFVSMPILRFLLLRWIFRLFLWYVFLWKVRKFPLHLDLFHPDRAGGLGFLGDSALAFAPVLAAQSVMLAGFLGTRIWYLGVTLAKFKVEIGGAVLFLMLTVLAPLTFFIVPLVGARIEANREFSVLASRYVDEFRRKWILRDAAQAQPLLGTSDIQTLADLGTSFDVVRGMNILPVNGKTILGLALIVCAPLAPLALTMVPLERLMEGVIKLVL